MNTTKALELGCLPEPYFSKDRASTEKLLTSYTSTYLHEEILVETMIRDLQGFANFLKITAENSGHLLDFSKISSKARVSRSATRRYYEIVEDSMICDQLPSYFDPENPDRSQTLVKHSRYYLFDLGIKNGILGNFVASKDRIGFLFEHLFYNQIKNILYCLDKSLELSFFRTHQGHEIDFVIKNKNRDLMLIELKTNEPDEADLNRLKKAAAFFPTNTPLYVACIKCTPKKKGDVRILPWQQVLKDMIAFI